MRNLQTSASIHRDFVTIAPHIQVENIDGLTTALLDMLDGPVE